ncbi:hypothetical protein GCM10025867_43120 [Frondihabitans sucicola]|uniref:CDP-alcohol phosphatidyltransferase family protein n=2 Tax=Frondihabitans sucicola TaxID=1268041 RepID=A0ABM8GUB5_9MICO|nr:hypothetical protein GCM10025867_43120 [Frondihabitans sucicola]
MIIGFGAIAGYLVVTAALLLRGLRRRRARRFGAANVVTSARATLVGLITGLIVASFFSPVPQGLLEIVLVPALALDAVDGWVARRTGTATELGARFDMEVDAFLLLVLSVAVAPRLGAWVLAIGLMRYVFVAAGWILPRLRGALPFRFWRKVAAASQGWPWRSPPRDSSRTAPPRSSSPWRSGSSSSPSDGTSSGWHVTGPSPRTPPTASARSVPPTARPAPVLVPEPALGRDRRIQSG